MPGPSYTDSPLFRADGTVACKGDALFLKTVTVKGFGDGVITNYDLIVGGDEYGVIKIGDACFGRVSFKAGNIDLDGSILCQNKGGPVTGNIEFIWTESTGGTARFVLPKSGVGLATYNSRSMLLAGPAPADTDFVTVGYWQGQGIFDKLVCDTVGSGAQLGVQGSMECEDTIYCDTLAESTTAAGVTIDGALLKDGDIYVALKVGHIGDVDTSMQFTPNRILWEAGGIECLTAFVIGGNGDVTINQGRVDVNFRVATSGRPSALQIDGGRDTVNLSGAVNTIGDGGTADYVRIDVAGKVFFAGAAGLPFGEIYASDNAVATVIALAGQANRVQVTIFTADGVSNNMTPDHTNDHITVTKAGMYLCLCSIHIASVGGGGADTFGFSVYKNNGTTEFANCHAHRKLAGGGGDIGSLSISGLIDLAAGNTIELWCWNESSGDDVIVEDVTLNLVQIGGT